MEGDVTRRMAIDPDHGQTLVTKFDHVAVSDALVEAGDGLAVPAGADDGCAGGCLDGGNPAHVVTVVVGDQDGIDVPALLFRRCQHRRCLTGVHAGHPPRGLVPHQIDVVVGEDRDDFDLKSHGRRPV